MSLWEYKHITSGPHGFATPALLESYLNQLGKDEWEIISYETIGSNTLAFNGVARRTTLRDWTLEGAAAAAAKVEADKLRAEFAAKFAGNAASGGGADGAGEKPTSLVAEHAAGEDGFRKLRDTERDGDPDAGEEGDDWDNWDNLDDDLPTFFEAIKPHLRKNQRGPGQSVGVTFLAKRWEQSEGDLIGALKECGFVIPETEDAAPEHLEFEGELYWLNLNNRHELFLNTREKPRPVFRTVPAKKLDPSDPAAALLAEEAAAEQTEKELREAERVTREAEHAARRAEQEARRIAAQAQAQAAREAAQAAREAAQAQAAAARAAAIAAAAAVGAAAAAGTAVKADVASPAVVADGAAPVTAVVAAAAPPEAESPVVTVALEELPPEAGDFLAAVREQMRRNRRGPGYSGSIPFLARAFKQSEEDLVEMFAAVGLAVPATAADKPVKTGIGEYVYWLNKDSRGGIWINGDEARAPKTADTAVVAATSEPVADAGATGTAAATPEVKPPAAETVSPVKPVTVPVAEPAVVVPPVIEPAVAAALAEPVTGTASKASLSAVRLLLKPNKRGANVSAEVSNLAKELGQDLQAFLTVLTDLGLALPATEEHKPSFVEHAGEIFWLNKNPKDGAVWINAKAAKSAAAKKPKAGAKTEDADGDASEGAGDAGAETPAATTAKPRTKRAAKVE